MSLRSLFFFSTFVLLSSCSDDKKQSNGPIVLGDSSTIVTENDSKYLSDYVDDLQLRTTQKDTIAKEQQQLSAQNNSATEVTSSVKEQVDNTKRTGLSIPFKEVTVFISDIKTRSYRPQNPQNANGATYQWLDGRISGNQLELSGATITKVSQRYISGVIAKTELGTLELDALGKTSDWTPLKGNGNNYTIAELDNAQAKNATRAQIRLAVSRAAKNKRMSRQNIQKWERAVKNVRSLNQKPFEIIARSVMWKIEGKDANGKNFQKQVRIDIHP